MKTRNNIASKVALLSLLFAAMGSFTQANPMSSGACLIQILSNDYNHWHDMTEGFIYGFYSSPPENVGDCTFCDEMG